MANEVNTYEVDLSKLTQRVDELRNQEKQLKAQQDALTKAFKEGRLSEQQYQNATRQLGKQIDTLKNQQKQLENTIKKQKVEIVDYGKKLNGVGDALGKLGGLGVGGFGEIGNAIKSLVSGPFGLLTLAIGAVVTLWEKMSEKARIEAEDTAKSIESVYERARNAQSKSTQELNNLFAEQTELRAKDLKTEEERERFRQKENDRLIAFHNEELKALQKKADFYGTLEQAERALEKAQENNFHDRVDEFTKIIEQYKLIDSLTMSNETKERRLRLARQKDMQKEKEDAEKKAEEDKKKAVELAKARLEADKQALTQLEDLKVKAIADDTERQKAQIELNKKRAIQALNEIYKKASANGKKNIKEAIALLEQTSTKDIELIDTNKLLATYQKLGVNLTNAMKEALYENNNEDWFDIVGMSDANIKEKFDKIKDNAKAYEAYLKDFEKQLKKLYDVNIQPNKDKITDAKLYKKEITEIQAETEKYENATQAIVEKQLELEEKQTELYETNKRNISAIYQDADKRNQKLAELEKSYQQEIKNIQLNAQAESEVLEAEHQERIKAIRQQGVQNYINLIDEASNALNAFAELQMATANDESKSDRQREKAKRKALNLQIASVHLGMANSLAQGISTATSSSSNWIEMLIAIATTVASVVSQFAQIKSLMSQKNSGGYAEGGYVSGKGSGTSDSIDAKLSNGEYVVNASATRDNLPLLDAINYGNSNALATQLAMAVQTIPNPIVSVETIEQVQSFKNQVSAFSHL